MSEALPSSFHVLRQGFHFLRQRLRWSLGLAALSMLLSALGAYFQHRMNAGQDVPKLLLLGSAAVLPMEMYFIPRFLMAVDAETLNRPENPSAEWRERFEGRWLRTFGAKLLLAVAIGAGFMLLVFPGLLILLFFGWAPTLVLLRGLSISEAARRSARWMAQLWPRIVFSACAILAIYLGLALGAFAFHSAFVPEPTPLAQLRHPAAWASQFLLGLVNLWFSAAFLALFHDIEKAAELTNESVRRK